MEMGNPKLAESESALDTGIKMLPFAGLVANQGPRAGSRDSSATLKVVVSGVVRAFGLITRTEKSTSTINNEVMNFSTSAKCALSGRRTSRCAEPNAYCPPNTKCRNARNLSDCCG